MNNQSPDFRAIDVPTPSEPSKGEDSRPPLLGAVDIVEAFTAMRHELKLQVRGGRELQETLQTTLERLEQRLTALQQTAASSTPSSDEGRRLAEAVAEIEESLRRVWDTMSRQSASQQSAPCRLAYTLLDQFDGAVAHATWGTRKFAGRLLQEIRGMIEQAAAAAERTDESFQETCRGLELLLARVHRLMQQCAIERVDVLHQPFDAETMHAIDVIDDPDVASSHVAQQLRPAYLWQGRILRYADVRLAR